MNKDWEVNFVQLSNGFIADLCKLSGAALKLYLILRVHKGGHDTCWPSYKVIQEEAGLSRDSVSRAKSELIEDGLITVTRRFNKSNEYSFPNFEDKYKV
jgi:hypothetical protein